MIYTRIIPVIALVLFIGFVAMAEPTWNGESLRNLSIVALEQRLDTIDRTCAQLASCSLRNGMGSLGCESRTFEDASNTTWMQVDLGADITIDEIVLVPVIWRDANKGYVADGFPLEFSILAGTDRQTNMVVSFGAEDRLLPRLAPLVVPCPVTTASWVRVEATTLLPRVWDGKFDFKLSELMVFDGKENVALLKPVEVSSRNWRKGSSGARGKGVLVDGFTPYVMDASGGEKSMAFVSGAGVGDHPSLTIDLKDIHVVNRVHLHAVEITDTVPQSAPTEYGIPPRLLVEGATRADFSDSAKLFEYHYDSVFDVGPIIMRRFQSISCKYIRLTAIEPYILGNVNEGASNISFAEIEVFSGGRNVALEKPVSANFQKIAFDRSFSALTDGNNFYGRIMGMREWMEELALRRDLESERPTVAAELNLRYERQAGNLRWMSWFAAILGCGIGSAILIERGIRIRQIVRLKQRFAADLHDELGANLYAIGLFGELAKNAIGSPDELLELIDEMRNLTERTGSVVRYCTDMQNAELHEDLLQDMQCVARRMTTDIEFDFSVDGGELLDDLRPSIKTDLFLFFKESLVNVSRHSDASKVSAALSVSRKEIGMTICDNGRGIEEAGQREVPASLRRRAKLFGARVEVGDSQEGGTCVSLELRLGRFAIKR